MALPIFGACSDTRIGMIEFLGKSYTGVVESKFDDLSINFSSKNFNLNLIINKRLIQIFKLRKLHSQRKIKKIPSHFISIISKIEVLRRISF